MKTADEILNYDDTLKREKVDVPEWETELFVKVMSGAERDRWELSTTALLKTPNLANIRASLCVMTICDEKGKRLFTDEQINALGEKSAVVLDRIFDIARRINRLNDDDIEELEKNLEPAVRAVSGSN